MKINNVRLLVNDFNLCFNFYANILKLKTIWGKPGDVYASFDIGNSVELAIFSSQLMAEAVGNSDKVSNDNCRDKFAIVISVDSVDNSYETFLKEGVSFINSPMNMEAWGIRVAHLRDPENNLFEICSEI